MDLTWKSVCTSDGWAVVRTMDSIMICKCNNAEDARLLCKSHNDMVRVGSFGLMVENHVCQELTEAKLWSSRNRMVMVLSVDIQVSRLSSSSEKIKASMLAIENMELSTAELVPL